MAKIPANSLANLVPTTKLSPERKAEISKKGGEKSGIARRKRKLFQELAIAFLRCPADEKTRQTFIKNFPDFSEDEVTQGLLMIKALHARAMRGDVKAFEVLRDTAGEKPVDRVDLQSSDGSMAAPPPVTIDLSKLPVEKLIELTRAAFRGE